MTDITDYRLSFEFIDLGRGDGSGDDADIYGWTVRDHTLYVASIHDDEIGRDDIAGARKWAVDVIAVHTRGAVTVTDWTTIDEHGDTIHVAAEPAPEHLPLTRDALWSRLIDAAEKEIRDYGHVNAAKNVAARRVAQERCAQDNGATNTLRDLWCALTGETTGRELEDRIFAAVTARLAS